MSQDGIRDDDVSAPVPSAPTEGLPEAFFTLGQILGDRYQIRSQLGRGGMGEVWRAFDLKLRVEVALKALREDLFRDGTRRDLLRREVRAAREVVSPNVCRIFDLIEADGRELVSMEFVDGQTLLGVLRERGPLELKEAQDVASQFLAGLEAIHRAGLVHRDVKPENIMLTRAGRVVVMDFGLARQEAEGSGSVSGTPAYMAPEQAAGLLVDARADVYSAGVVLAEMVSPGGVKDLVSRQSAWEGVRQEPARVPDTPWAPVLKMAVAKERDQRFSSAHTLTRALEEVTLRVEGAEDLTPYPGLASFTEADTEYFFGREAEVEGMWAKLEGPARLLGLVGPSGAGKTSFLRAGLIPSASPEWAVVRCTPGTAAMASLRRALVPALGGDTEALGALATTDDDGATVSAFSRWRNTHGRALVVVDQAEELFTLNPPETQTRLADLLRRLPLESDVHVVLSMRDDFLMECSRLPALRPVVSDLTLLNPPVGANLRRALVQPAMKCGYRFEDDELVEEMLAEVGGERGALPMLAFAAARLWEGRNRGSGLLTREAYSNIGGVSGALAQHAEPTIDHIGSGRIAVVRELFRNLVTAEGTRAVREWHELLSVFEEDRRQAAREVLGELVDARLLTSYEVHEEGETPTRRVEIVHESLLESWPRLERWLAQDAEGALLRDQLRQAAQTWDEHDRSDDLLWTGTAFREYQLWRERYPGGLSDTEEAFAEAMTRYAGRRRRRRRIAAVAAFVVLLGVLAIIGSLWRSSESSRRLAESETRRAEAASLFSLAQLKLEDHPTATIAYAIASLELADSPTARRLALAALWQGPTEIRLQTRNPWGQPEFSPDGRWLATADPWGGGSLWPRDGGPPTALEGSTSAAEVRISPKGDLVAASMDMDRGELGLWSFPDGRFLRPLGFRGRGMTACYQFSRDGERLFTSTEILTEGHLELEVRSWPVAGGEPDLLALLELPTSSLMTGAWIDPTESRFSWADGPSIHIARLEGTALDLGSATRVDHDRTIAMQMFDSRGRQLVTADTGGDIRIWSLEHDPPELTHTLSGEGGLAANAILLDPSGLLLASMGGALWDLTAPPDSCPLQLRSSGDPGFGLAFGPESKWLVTTGFSRRVSLWPLARTYPRVFRAHDAAISGVVFTPDGLQLVSASEDGSVRLWSLGDCSGERSRILERTEGVMEFPGRLAMAPNGSFLVAGHNGGRVAVFPLDGSPSRELRGFTYGIGGVAVGSRAHLVAAGTSHEEGIVRVWDLESGKVRILDAGDGAITGHLEFTGPGELLVESGLFLRRWDLKGGSPRIVEETDLSGPEQEGFYVQDFSPDGSEVLFIRRGLWIHDLERGASRELSSHGAGVTAAAFDPGGEIVVSADRQGSVRVGPADGGEPHLLLGHEGGVNVVAVSPNGRWIASGGKDTTIRLWPMPDFSKPPLHTLPRDELIAKLKTLTNLRAVADPGSPTGWKLEVGPFPGWETVPSW